MQSAHSGLHSTQQQHGGRPGGGIGRSLSRSLSRARQAIGASVRNFGKGRDASGLDAWMRSNRSTARSCRSLDKSGRTSMRMMPNYDFLSKGGEKGHADQRKSQIGRTICADDLISMIFLTIARCTAWFDYPLYMLLFLSKANNLNNFLQKTALRCWINFSDYHCVYLLFGMNVGVESACHTFYHVLRWAWRNSNIQLLWTSKTGVAGLVTMILCPFIVLLMTVPYLKKRMKFEWRKDLHYLSVV
ncbi:hypothetical protein ACHAWF_010683 [Thalassiosira exigua]